MHRRFIAILSLLTMLTLAASATTFDKWKTYMAYGEITDIEPAGNYIYVLSSGNLFSYNCNDGSVDTYDKIFPLSDCAISHIAWNNTAKRLIIIYENNNIDLLNNKAEVVNIADYCNKTMTVDKTIFNVVINGNLAYLCTAFGIVEVDMKDGIIRETYNIGKPIYNCTVKGNNFYATTTGTKLKASRTNNLLNPASWIETSDNVDFSHPNDISVTTENGYTEYFTYDTTRKCYWSNQEDNKLQAYTIDNSGNRTVTNHDINPVGPQYNYFGFMKFQNGKMYTCNGGIWDSKKPAAIQIYDTANDSWTSYSNEGIADKYNVEYWDILCLEVDPDDDNHVFAGTQSGLYEFRNGNIVNRFDSKNSTISYSAGLEGNINYQIITSLFYDRNKTLWALVSEAGGNSVITYNQKDGWKAPAKNLTGSDVVNGKFMGYDKNGRLWIVSGRYDGRAVYCYSADYSNLFTYNTFVNEDGTSISGYECLRGISEDKEGNIWIASNVGVLTLNDEFQRDPSKGFYQIKVPRNDGTNYADYLMANIDLTCIAIDNANRKWIGTLKNGIYVISADNMTQEAHITAENSCLLSNVINYIAIDKLTGRTYIATDKGLCSVESYASETNESMEKDNVWAYPNPVTPDYTGMVTVVGLSFNADVKITTTNGTLVAEGRSNGGSFQWNCTDRNGKRVASGIYMVNTATESGESGTVCKIAVVN